MVKPEATRSTALLVRGLGSLVVLVGLPAALVYGFGWPPPYGRHEVWAWSNAPTRMTVRGLTGAGACLLWLMWAATVVAVAADLVGTAVIALTTTAARAAAPAPTKRAEAAAGTLRPVTLIPAASSSRRSDPGMELPDHGWVAAPVAAAVAAASALVWIQRRRRYRPRPSAGPRRDDRDLTPLPHTIAVLQRARAQPMPDAVPETTAETTAEAMEAGTVTQTVFGTNGGQPLRLSDVPVFGLGLVGPAAHDAGRGVLAAVLSSGGPWAVSEEATLITTTADLDTLLGPGAADRYRPPRLLVFTSLTEASADLERQLLQRAGLEFEHHAGGLGGLGDDGERSGLGDDGERSGLGLPPASPPLPPVVLLTRALTGPGATRLAAILAVGSLVGIAGVLLGTWTTGSTWRVSPDGTARPDDGTGATPGRRLNVLDRTAAGDILTTLQQARSDDDDHRPSPPPAQPPGHPTPSQAAGTHSDEPSTPRDVRGRSLEPRSGANDVTTRPATVRPGAAARRLRLTVLGKPAIQLIADQPSEEIRIRRTDGRRLLVYLAVSPDGATSAQLMEALWPEVPPASSRNRFHTTISELRKALKGALGADAITHTDDRYRLDPIYIDVDLWHFNTAVEQAATAVDPAAHLRAIREVVRLYTGHLADGYSWLWLARYREATRRHVLDAYAQLADTETDPRAALALVQDAIGVDPYGEDLYQRAMRLYAVLGSADGVHRTLRAIAERLSQFDVGVSSQTEQLAADLLAQLDTGHRRSRTT